MTDGRAISTEARSRRRRLKWTIESIALNCTAGPVQREALMCRGLAVHRYGRGWTVTHVASGRAIVPTGLSRRNAFRWARALLSLGDWTGPIEVVMCYKRRVAGTRALLFAPIFAPKRRS